MNQLTEKAIILKVVKHLDSNLIIHALNAQGSKLNLFARGAVKSKKRFGGAVLEPLNFVQLVYKPAPEDGADALGQLKEASLINSFPLLRTDYDRIELAFYFLRLVLKLSQPGTLDGDSVFNLLGHALKNLETSANLQNLKLQFELKLLALQGVLPRIPDAESYLCSPLAEHHGLVLESSRKQSVQLSVGHVLEDYLGNISI